MKTKASVFLALLVSGAAVQAGPRLNVVVNPGAAACRPAPICRPVPIYRPAPICRPVVYRTFSTWWGTAPTAFYSWGPSVVVASNGSGFRTVSPLMDYTGQTPIYKVPAPILPAQPLVTYPGTSFRWRN